MANNGVSMGEVFALAQAIPGSATAGAIAAQRAAEAAQAAAEKVLEDIPEDYSTLSSMADALTHVDLTESGYISGTGAEVAQSDYRRTGYIPVAADSVLILDGFFVGSTSGSAYAYYFYTADKTPISGANGITTRTVVDTIPSTAAFVRFSSRTSQGETPVAYVSNHVVEDVADLMPRMAAAEADVADLKSAIEFTNSYVMESVPTALPGILKGNFAIELGSESSVFCGTQNVAQLFGIKEGTYDCRGCTITVTGNKVKLNGTVSNGGPYWGLTSGSMVSQADAGAVTLPLPERKYTLSQYLTSGSSCPPLCIRSKSNSNIIALNNNTGVFTFSASTCGELYIALSATTYNCEFTIALFPYETTNGNAYRNTDSSVMTISADGTYQLDGYTWGSGTFSIAELRTKLPKKPQLKYSTRTIAYSSMQECVDIYIPAKTGYINYIFGRTQGNGTQAEGYGNVWRLVQIDAVGEALDYRFHITQLGETEMALQLVGRDDFIGGSTHGDEWMDANSLLFVMDGETVDVTSLTTLTEFKTLQVYLVSTLYDPDDHTTVVGSHGREWIFNENGLYIGQTIAFAGEYTLGNSYAPMLCALRGNDTASALQITDTYVDDGNYQKYDVGAGGFTGYPNNLKSDVREINLFGTENKVKIKLSIIEQPEGLKGEGVFLYNGVNTYNKIYCTLCGYGNGAANRETVTANTKWHIKSQITIDVG